MVTKTLEKKNLLLNKPKNKSLTSILNKTNPNQIFKSKYIIN